MTTDTRRLNHPWWVHLPALAALVWLLLLLQQLPAPIPLHWLLNGRADRWGSPWEMAIAQFVILALSVWVDEVWARQETRKTFNWLSLIDDGLVGWALGIAIVLRMRPDAGYHDLLVQAWPYALGAVLLAVVAECVRPFRPHPQATPVDVDALQHDIVARQQAGMRWAYWEQQNPSWFRVVILISGFALLTAAVLQWSHGVTWAVAVRYLLPAAALFAFYGGLRVFVSGERLEVRLGLFGIPLLRLATHRITEAVTYSFSPLREFGGYGIRVNTRMIAFFLRGNRGVKIRTARGLQILIGSDHPEQLAAAIQAAISPAEQ